MTTTTTSACFLLSLCAASYVRVSTPDQARRGTDPDGLSIPAQREANRRRALEMGALIAAEFHRARLLGQVVGAARTAAHAALHPGHAGGLRDRPQDRPTGSQPRRRRRDHEDDSGDRRAPGLYDGSDQHDTKRKAAPWDHGVHRGVLLPEPRNRGDEGHATEGNSGRYPGRAPLGYLNQHHIEDGREIRTVTVDPERGPHLAWHSTPIPPASGAWTRSPPSSMPAG